MSEDLVEGSCKGVKGSIISGGVFIVSLGGKIFIGRMFCFFGTNF